MKIYNKSETNYTILPDHFSRNPLPEPRLSDLKETLILPPFADSVLMVPFPHCLYSMKYGSTSSICGIKWFSYLYI